MWRRDYFQIPLKANFMEVFGRHQIVIVVQAWVHFVPLAKHLRHTTSLLEREHIPSCQTFLTVDVLIA